ncbi:MAG: large conductance mechanosensitive channel protein MscL [Oscillospiraceae bacterium]|jgi:large conductance mechanosensitive channel|nr:large conductance mechanosensitive channel protein MscL [Oscillospiraceae bacterium]
MSFVKKFLKGFKEFAMRGNVMDLAVGVMIGGAFSQIVSSVVNDLVMPLIGLLLGRINLAGLFIALDGKRYASAAEAAAAGAGVFNYGSFITKVIDFVLMALVIYAMVTVIQRIVPKPKEAPGPEPRLCPYCKSVLDADATRCPNCTSYLVDELPDDVAESLGLDDIAAIDNQENPAVG